MCTGENYIDVHCPRSAKVKRMVVLRCNDLFVPYCSQRGILKPGATGIYVKEFLLDRTLAEKKPQKTLKLFNRFVAIKPLNMAIYEKFLDAFADDASMVRRVFEEAIREFGTDNEGNCKFYQSVTATHRKNVYYTLFCFFLK